MRDPALLPFDNAPKRFAVQVCFIVLTFDIFRSFFPNHTPEHYHFRVGCDSTDAAHRQVIGIAPNQIVPDRKMIVFEKCTSDLLTPFYCEFPR